MIRCNDCGEIFPATKIHTEAHCPHCGKWNLRSVFYSDDFSDDDLLELWVDFLEIGTDKQNRTTDSFIGFEAGTSRRKIGTWFDVRCEKGIAWLIGNGYELAARRYVFKKNRNVWEGIV